MTKRLAFFSLLLACCTLMAAPVFTLSNAKPLQIVTSPNATPAETLAANELHDYLKKLCGAECPIVSEKDATTPAIYVGQTEFAKKQVGDLSKLADEEWIIRTSNGSLIITGGRPRGTLYGVYEFLEGQGIVWADETTEYVPSMKELRFDAPLNLQDKPALLGRNVYTQLRQPTKASAMFYIRNKLNHYHTITAEYGGGFSMGRPDNCHTFHAYSKPEWPDEWFMLGNNGKRLRSTSSSGPGQFCLTNPDLRKAMVARLREFIEADRKGKSPDAFPKIYDISHNDSDNHCICPDCKALAEREGSYSGPMLDFINYIANAIAKDYPDILIQTFAYTWTLDAPKTIRPAKNVMMRICKLGCEFYPSGKADTMFPVSHPRNKDYHDNFVKWAAISENIAVWDYWIIYTKGERTPPYVNITSAREDIRFYRDNHVKTMFVEFEKPLYSCFTYFRLWYGLKLMQNPDKPYDSLVNSFFNAYYGYAAKPMRQYMEYLQKRMESSDICLGTAPIVQKILIPSKPDFKTPNFLPYLDKEFFMRSNAWLDEAEKLATQNPVFLEHVRKERLSVDKALLDCAYQYPKTALPVGSLIDSTADALFARYDKNITAQAQKFFNSDIYPKRKNELDNIASLNAELKERLKPDASVIPPEFRDRQCLYLKAYDWHGTAVIDNDSPMKNVRMLNNEKTENFHRLPFQMGIYNKRKQLFQTTVKLGADEIPQDGKFHWHKLGRFEVMPTSILWTHWTWKLQMPLDAAYLGEGEDNTWDIYVSMKLTGKPYIKGSEDPAKVLMEAILLVK